MQVRARAHAHTHTHTHTQNSFAERSKILQDTDYWIQIRKIIVLNYNQ